MLFFIFAAADPIVISAAELVYLGDLAQNMLSHVPGLMMQSEAGNKNVRVEMENYMSLDMTTAASFGLSCHLEMGDSRLRRFELIETTRMKLHLSKEQSLLLEESFKDHSTLNPVRC